MRKKQTQHDDSPTASAKGVLDTRYEFQPKTFDFYTDEKVKMASDLKVFLEIMTLIMVVVYKHGHIFIHFHNGVI